MRRAEAAFKRAAAALDAKDYVRALENYRESYALWPRPRTLLNVGAVLRKLGRDAEAGNLLAEYLEQPAAEAKRIASVRTALAEIDRAVGVLVFRDDEDGPARMSAPVTIDGQAVDRDLLRRPFRVAPGHHDLTRGEATASYEVSAGQTIEVVFTPPAPVVVPAPIAPAAPSAPFERPAPRPHAASTTSTAYLWGAAITVAAAGATVYLGLGFRHDQRAFDDARRAQQTTDYADLVRARDAARSSALQANVGIAVTAAGVGVTALLFALRHRHGEPPALTVAPGPGVAGIAVARAW